MSTSRESALARATVDGDAAALRRAVTEFVRRGFRAGVARWLFGHWGAASTYGLELTTGRRIVVKVHPGFAIDRSRLEASRSAQRRLWESGFPCPEPLSVVRPLGRGLATAETFMDAGSPPDPDDPSTHRALAVGLVDMTRVLADSKDLAALDAELLGRYPLRPLWPDSHDPRVDLAATADGAEWIDAIAREARSRRYSTPVGRVVVGHNDWRVEHVRVRGGRIVAAFDWDSVVLTREPLLVASAIRGFTADWSESFDPVVPTLAQVRTFIDAYEGRRGARFGAVERALIYAGWVDALAYAARWEHGFGLGRTAGGFQERLAADAPALLGWVRDRRCERTL